MRQPENLIEINYAANQSSVDVDELGMRDMQRRVFAEKDAQYLLVKAPPASGKSRALMFVALDKLFHQGINKIIIAVPERSIGASFASTALVQHGFFADWEIEDRNNLCTPGGDSGKVDAFLRFLEGDDTVLVLSLIHI